MGQVMRMMRYDRSLNEQNAIPALNFLGSNLSWHRLDDGVMGGRSETLHESSEETNILHFKGTINTDGGGFTSIRAPIPSSGLPKNIEALRMKFRGDGKTYKVLLSNGNAGGPFSRNPSWQIDLPTQKCGDYEEIVLPLKDFKPSFGGSTLDSKGYSLEASDIREIGFMLSLKLSDGRSNPPETFGEGIFDFSLEIDSMWCDNSSK